MNRWLDRIPLFSDSDRNKTVLKIVTIVAPALFVFLLELLRHALFTETRPMFWGTVSLFAVVLTASFFFSRLVFRSLDRLQRQNVLRMKELAILNEVHQSLDEFHNQNALLNRAIEKMIEVTDANSAELYLVDEQSHVLANKIHTGILKKASKQEKASKQDAKFRLKERLIDEGDRLNKRVIMENLSESEDEPAASLWRAGARSLAIIPLQSKSGTIGVACLFSSRPDHFRPEEAKLLLNVGNRIALAIEKARLYEKVQAVAVLEERERISAELHDGLSQVLGYVITKSQATRQLLGKMITANDYLVELEDVAQEVYTDTREAILGLRTAISGDRSLVSALREYAVRFSQMHNIKTELSVGEHVVPSLSPQIELQAIRIVQEALSNVRKHASATCASIKVYAGDDRVTIAVEDDGKGFDVPAAADDWTKFGLRNMKERAASMNCDLLIASRPEKGTIVTLGIPLTLPHIRIEEGGKIESADSR